MPELQAVRRTPRGAKAPLGDGSIQYTPRRERKAAEDLLVSQRVRAAASQHPRSRQHVCHHCHERHKATLGSAVCFSRLFHVHSLLHSWRG